MRPFRAALWVFYDVILPSWRQHRLRTALTLIGVIIGVQVVVAIALVNRSTIASFQRTAETIAGGADLQISSGTVGVPEDLIAEVAARPDVSSAAGLIQGTLQTEWGIVTLFGADLLGDQRIRQTQFPKTHIRIPDELRFLNGADSIALSTSFAERAGLAVGSQLEAISPTGRVTLTVRGLLDPVGPAALFGGAVALADLPTAQRLCALGNRVDQIDIKLNEGADIVRTEAELATRVEGVGTVGPPRDRAARLGSMLTAVQTVLTLAGLFSIVVGAFIIYHTMQTAIVQRRRDLALSRAVGFSAVTVVGALALEAVALGTIGAILGVFLGAAGARLSLDVVTSGISAIWARIDHSNLALTLGDVGLGCALGIGMSAAAAVTPSREILRIRILEHLHDQSEDRNSAALGKSIVMGLFVACFGFSLAYVDLRPDGFSARIAYIMASVVLLAFGYVLLAPGIALPVMWGLAWVARQWSGITFALAIENLARAVRRGAGATAALMVAFAMVLIAGAFIGSLRGSMMTWVEQTLADDLQVLPSSQLPLPASPTLPGGIETTVRETAGVAEVNPSRVTNIPIGDTLAVLRTESSVGIRRHVYPLIESDGDDWLERFDRGEAVLVSDNLSFRHGLRAGNHIAFDTPSGRKQFVIAAVVIDYTLDVGTILIESRTYKRVWQDDLVNVVGVWLDPGVDADLVRRQIAERVSSKVPVTIISGRELRRTVSDALDGALVMTYAIQLLAIVIALIGLVNFFLAEVEDRRREIGLLRGVALDTRELMRVLMLEAMVIGMFGGLMAVLYAWPVSLMLVTRSTRLVSGWGLTFTFPYGLAAATVVIAGITSMVAAYYPFRRAAAVPIAELVTVE